MDQVMEWLLGEDNPAVAYRTRVELLNERASSAAARDWIYGKMPENWWQTKGLWFTYYMTALSECGLARADVPEAAISAARAKLDAEYERSCADFMLLNALVKLGCAEESCVSARIAELRGLPDGGFLCDRLIKKFDYTPKSCYRANLHALMLLAQCEKRGLTPEYGSALIKYFLNRDIFYKSYDKTALALDEREGWRAIDAFYPFEPMRVGLQNIVEAFSALGYWRDKRLEAALKLMEAQKHDGKIALSGTLTKSYLPRERVGKPSKWATFYALLAEKTGTA